MSDQVDVVFSDLLGLMHGKTVPEHRLEHPTHYAITCMAQGLNLDFLDTDGYGSSAGFPDMEARADAGTVRSWLQGRSTAMASLFHTDGRPLALDPRRQLSLLCDRFAEHGYRPMVGFEMEFFLLESLDPLRRLPVPDHRVYGIGTAADPSGTLERLVEVAEEFGIAVEGANSEFTPGQVEACLHYRPALEAADAALLFRHLTRQVARGQGVDVTYMARPFSDTVGNGLHANISLADEEGNNTLDQPDEPYGVSEAGRSFAAGLLHHHEALAALAAPTVNSYKRLARGMLSGYWANWGDDNRFSTVRLPGQRGAATRIEHRMADGTASPHVLLAGLLAAGLHGLEEKMQLPEPQTGDGDVRPNTERHAPDSLAAALDALEADTELCSYFEPDLLEVYVGLKRQENARWLESVTDWEQREYARVY